MHSIGGSKEGDVSASEEALLSRCGFLKLCGSGLTALAGLMLLGAAGCGSGEDQQDDQQKDQDDQQEDQDNDRCPQRC